MTTSMLVCLSGNPALDRRLRISSFALGAVNRATHAEVLPGGKAAHVALAAGSLGSKVVWLGFLGGSIGEIFAAELRQAGIGVLPVPTAAVTRVNLELVEDSGRVTELLEPGVAPAEAEQRNMLQLCKTALATERGALLVISGSLPPGMPADFYASVTEAARASGAKVFLDTSGDWLRAGLEARPDLVKINRSEAEAVLSPAQGPDWAAAACRELVKRGARSAAITLGEQGLVWLESERGPVWTARPPRAHNGSAVGCGDATLAGFAHAALKGLAGEKALRLAAACGSANCLAKAPGMISAQDVESLLPQIAVTQVSPGS